MSVWIQTQKTSKKLSGFVTKTEWGGCFLDLRIWNCQVPLKHNLGLNGRGAMVGSPSMYRFAAWGSEDLDSWWTDSHGATLRLTTPWNGWLPNFRKVWQCVTCWCYLEWCLKLAWLEAPDAVPTCRLSLRKNSKLHSLTPSFIACIIQVDFLWQHSWRHQIQIKGMQRELYIPSCSFSCLFHFSLFSIWLFS